MRLWKRSNFNKGIKVKLNKSKANSQVMVKREILFPYEDYFYIYYYIIFNIKFKFSMDNFEQKYLE